MTTTALGGVRNKLKALCYTALDCLHGAARRRATVRARDRVNRVALTVSPLPARGEAAPEHFPGSFFSPVEAAIYQALSAGPLVGKEIAKKTAQPFESGFRTILRNLVNRRVLRRAEAGGYAVATRGDNAGDKRK